MRLLPQKPDRSRDIFFILLKLLYDAEYRSPLRRVNFVEIIFHPEAFLRLQRLDFYPFPLEKDEGRKLEVTEYRELNPRERLMIINTTLLSVIIIIVTTMYCESFNLLTLTNNIEKHKQKTQGARKNISTRCRLFLFIDRTADSPMCVRKHVRHAPTFHV